MAKARDAIEARWNHNDEAKTYYLSKLDQYERAGFDTKQFHADLNSGDQHLYEQQIWELLLGCHLLDLGLNVQAPPNNAPDFLVEHDGIRIWIEAISPTPRGIPEDILRSPASGEVQVRDWPHEAILLRWTAALAEKHRKLLSYRQKGVVGETDRYVIAINGSQLAHRLFEEGISQWPWAAEAALGIGPIAVSVSRSSGEMGDPFVSARFRMHNANNSPVDTDSFWSDDYQGVSAILSAVRNEWVRNPVSMCVVHNPKTAVPMPRWLLGETLDVTGTIVGDELTATRTERPYGI